MGCAKAELWATGQFAGEPDDALRDLRVEDHSASQTRRRSTPDGTTGSAPAPEPPKGPNLERRRWLLRAFRVALLGLPVTAIAIGVPVGLATASPLLGYLPVLLHLAVLGWVAAELAAYRCPRCGGVFTERPWSEQTACERCRYGAEEPGRGASNEPEGGDASKRGSTANVAPGSRRDSARL